MMTSPQIFDYQRMSFEKLQAVAKACFGIQRQMLPIKPRTNTLIIGPSGSGKTHLARAVAQATGAAFLTINISEWILLGCSDRGAVNTWLFLLKFLFQHRNADGLILFLDEIDKLVGDSTWERFLRTEVFKLLDLQIPDSLKDDGEIPEIPLQHAKDVLSNRTLILAAGAFQSLWDSHAPSPLGFGEAREPSLSLPSLKDLTQTLPRELVNRFRAGLVILPQLAETDYRQMLHQTAQGMPDYLKPTFLRLGMMRIHEAVRNRQGCRFVEELLLDVIIHERALIQSYEPEPVATNLQTVAHLLKGDHHEPLA